MSEVRGYPNPNYTEENIRSVEELEEIADVVMIDMDHYEELVAKASALDMLTAAIKAMGSVDENIVRAVTGTLPGTEMVPKSEADSYFGWYMEAKKTSEERSHRIAALEHANSELREILRQNNIGEWGEKSEKQKEDA